MIAAKRAAAYDVELKQLFEAYNLRGDGVIHEDEFNFVQSLVTSCMGGSGGGTAALDRRRERRSGSVVVAACHSPPLPAPPAPPALKLKQQSRRSSSAKQRPCQKDAGDDELQRAMLSRSPSLELHRACDFGSVDQKGDGHVGFEDFKNWQLCLLDSSRKSSATKRHRLNCLVRELQRTMKKDGLRQSWQEASKSLEAAVTIEALERAIQAARSMCLGNLGPHEGRLMCMLEADALKSAEVAEASGQTLEAFAAVHSAMQRAQKAGIHSGMFTDHEDRVKCLRTAAVSNMKVQLEEANTLAKLEAALEIADSLFDVEVLEVYRSRLAHMKEPFLVHVQTLSGHDVPAKVSRSQSVRALREQVAHELSVHAYRVVIAHEGAPLTPDTALLEDCGVTSSIQLAACLAPQDRWQEASLDDVLQSAVERGVASKAEVDAIRHQFESGNQSDAECRASYAAKLKALDDEEAEARRIAEEREAERQRKLEEQHAELHRQADERQALRKRRCCDLDDGALMKRALDLGLVQDVGEKVSSRIHLVERVALLEGIQEENASLEALRVLCAEHKFNEERSAETLSDIRSDIQADLDESLPSLEPAIAALRALDKRDICEHRCFAKPPQLCAKVMAAVCILLQERPSRIRDPDNPGRMIEDYWGTSKRVLNDTRFLDRLLRYDKDNIPRACIQRLQPIFYDEDFVPEVCRKYSRLSETMCLWVRAMHTYHFLAAAVEPKRQILRFEEKALMEQMERTRQSLADLTNAEGIVERFMREYEVYAPL